MVMAASGGAWYRRPRPSLSTRRFANLPRVVSGLTDGVVSFALAGRVTDLGREGRHGEPLSASTAAMV